MAALDPKTVAVADDEEDGLLPEFLDAADEFPFHDCVVTPEEPSLSTTATGVSELDSLREVALSSILRRRHRLVGRAALASAGSNGSVSAERVVGLYPRLEGERGGIVRKGSSFEGDGELVSRERNVRFERHSKEAEIGGSGTERKGASFQGENESLNSGVESVVTEEVSSKAVEDNVENYDERVRSDLDVDDLLESSNDDGLLVHVAGLIIKAIGIQLYLLIKFLKFPFKVLYMSCLFFIDPFGTVRRVMNSFIGKLFRVWNATWAISSPYLGEWFGESKSWMQCLMRYGWGLFTAGYVCVVLFSFLVFAIIGSGFMMGVLVEKPTKIEEKMNFDYTKGSPVAYLPIVSCEGFVECAGKCEGISRNGNLDGAQVVPPRQKLAATVSLTLPESDYNKQLGIFQVRIDFLSASGQIISSRRRPCMLYYKSEPIRLLLTMLKIAPLVTGYVSESQTLKVKFKGFVEEHVRTSCVRLVIEQRAEFSHGGGIPEIYDASITVESELPFLKRMLWYWRRTIFIWLVMMFFVAELVFCLLCCRPIIFPRITPRNMPARNGSAYGPPTTQ
ncbi:hypothetical protein MLD38_010318 [Melastoma candidum]|uniref:Uncharacterized protein n=1 Tax=Melastoma candidum TaxID=119954 RepID=A0ACB9QYU5_9MYRT|nr:hypothetical protein MLD38_010318 [Melastoma candidum]